MKAFTFLALLLGTSLAICRPIEVGGATVHVPTTVISGEEITMFASVPLGDMIKIVGVPGEFGTGPIRLTVPEFTADYGMEIICRDAIEKVDVIRKPMDFMPATRFELPPGGVVPYYTTKGAFDGNAANTQFKLDSQALTILSESRSECTVLLPMGSLGRKDFSLTEGSNHFNWQAQILDANVMIDRPHIKIGEVATARLMVVGLRGLTDPLRVQVTTTHPEVVQPDGGTLQTLTIRPQEVASDGGWFKDIKLRGVAPGDYEVELRVPYQAPNDDFPPFHLNWVKPPVDIKTRDSLPLAVRATIPLEVVQFSVKRLEGGTPIILPGEFKSGVWSSNLPSNMLPTGFYTVQATGAGGDGQTEQVKAVVAVNDPLAAPELPGFGQDLAAHLAQVKVRFSPMIQASIGRLDSLYDERWSRLKAAREARDAAQDERSKADELRGRVVALAEVDKILEDYLDDNLPDMKRLAEEVRALGNSSGNATPSELEAKVATIKAEEAAEKEDCAKRHAQVQALEEEIGQLEADLEKLAKEVQEMFHADGWTGSARFDKAAGIVRWGFVGKGEGGHKLGFGGSDVPRYNQLYKDKKAKEKRLKQAKMDLEKAKEAVADCEDKLKSKAKAVADAEAAAKAGQEKAMKEAELENKCRGAEPTVSRLRRILRKYPDLAKKLEKEMDNLPSECPKTPEEVDAWERAYRELIKEKANLEKALEEEAQGHDAQAGIKEQEAQDAEAEAKALADEAARVQAEAARLERERRAAEAEQVRAAARAKAKRPCDYEGAFKKWLEDGAKKGWLDDEKLKKVLSDLGAKAVDVGGAAGGAAADALKEAAKGAGNGRITGTGIASGVINLCATLFYWYAEGKLREAIDRLRPALDNKEFQEAVAMAELEGRGKCHGVIEGRGKSYFWIRVGNRVMVFRMTSDGSLEVIGVAG